MTCMCGWEMQTAALTYQITDGGGTDGVDQMHRELHEQHYE